MLVQTLLDGHIDAKDPGGTLAAFFCFLKSKPVSKVSTTDKGNVSHSRLLLSAQKRNSQSQFDFAAKKASFNAAVTSSPLLQVS